MHSTRVWPRGSEKICSWQGKTYPAESCRDAVELYRSTPSARVAGIAADLGISSLAGAVFHRDRGAQFGSRAYTVLCTRLGATHSMGAVGTSADNAMAESLNATLRREPLAGAADWPDATTARREVFTWINRHNTRLRERPPRG